MNFIKRRNHKRTILLICILLYPLIHVQADADSLHRKVEAFGIVLPQEKVYLHLDNTCYFLGDTIWYKGYVTQSNTGTLTTMSRILYVELLTPDGYLVERQQLEMPDGMAHGMFVLTDSLYAGYYELRAYTGGCSTSGSANIPASTTKQTDSTAGRCTKSFSATTRNSTPASSPCLTSQRLPENIPRT